MEKTCWDTTAPSCNSVSKNMFDCNLPNLSANTVNVTYALGLYFSNDYNVAADGTTYVQVINNLQKSLVTFTVQNIGIDVKIYQSSTVQSTTVGLGLYTSTVTVTPGSQVFIYGINSGTSTESYKMSFTV